MAQHYFGILTAGLMQLRENIRACGVYCICDFLPAGAELVRTKGRLQRRTEFRILYPGDLRDDQAVSAFGAGFIISHGAVCRIAAQLRESYAHGAHYKTVFQLQLAYAPGSNNLSYLISVSSF